MNKWINAVLGLVVLLVAFVDLTGTTLTWTLGLAGAILVTNSIWGLLNELGERKSHGHRTQSQM